MANRRRSLLRHGMALFLLGLIVGLVEEKLRNPRMGLAAHLEGLMNGTFLIAVGSAWSDVRLSRRLGNVAFGAALYGAYANWVTTTLAAIFGTAALTPLTSGALHAAQWQELVVGAGFISVALAMLVSSALLLWSFRGEEPPMAAGPASG